MSRCHSHLSFVAALRWPRLRVCILLRKLAFLVKLLQCNHDKISSRVFRTLAFEDVSKISLVEQCQQLGCEFGTSYLEKCLNNPDNAHLTLREAKEMLISRDWEIVLGMANSHQSTNHVSDPRILTSWCRFWDLALDRGVHGTRLYQHLDRFLETENVLSARFPSTRGPLSSSMCALPTATVNCLSRKLSLPSRKVTRTRSLLLSHYSPTL